MHGGNDMEANEVTVTLPTEASAAVKALNPAFYGSASRPVETVARPAGGKSDVKAEKDLQAMCENWLTLNGYARLTAENAAHGGDYTAKARGWFAHLYECRKNPLSPDLMIYNRHMTRCLMIELKPAGKPIRFQPGQQEMVAAGSWWIARSLETVKTLVEVWEQ